MKISEKTNIYKLIKTYPQALELLISKGFSLLRKRHNQKTIAKFVNVRQACLLTGIDLDLLITELNEQCNPDGSFESREVKYIEPEISTMDLLGDITIIGIVPCPVRNITIESFDKYSAGIAAKKGSKLSWLFFGENPGVKAIEPWIKSVVELNDVDKIPDIFMAVGSKLFLYNKYFRIPYNKNIFKALPNVDRRSELAALEDPNKRLNLQYCVLFSFLFTKANPELPEPKCWTDLADPIYRNSIFIPDLDLPIIADLLSTLYSYFGDEIYMNLLDNVLSSTHPAKSMPRQKSIQEPSIIIAPLHFLKMNSSYKGFIPNDGFVAIPAFISSKNSSSEEGKDIVHHLLSTEYMNSYWEYGSFIPNNRNIDVDIDLSKLITRPWSIFLDQDPDKSIEDIINTTKRRINYESFNN